MILVRRVTENGPSLLFVRFTAATMPDDLSRRNRDK